MTPEQEASLIVEATEIAENAAMEAGLVPRKAFSNLLFLDLLDEWFNARIDRNEFIHACKNLAILNPELTKP